MDVSISSGSGSSNTINFVKNQDLNSAAIESELSTAFVVPVTSHAAGSQPTAAAQSTTPASVAATAAAGSNRVGVVTVTEMIHDTVTIYQTRTPTPSPAPQPATAAPASEASNGAVIVAPFQTGKSANPTTLATLATKAAAAADVVVTTVEDVVVESLTSTVYATSETPAAPRIRGRLLGSGHPRLYGGGWG
jgi:hypothetical protein